MWNREYLSAVPELHSIREEIYKLDIGDEFSGRIDALSNRLEEEWGRENIWLRRLELFELERRKVWFQSIIGLADSNLQGYVYARMSMKNIKRWMKPARFVPWESLFRLIRGKHFTFEHGSYRNLPSPSHVKYVNYGFVNHWDNDLNILSLDPANVIKGRKGEDKLVFDDQLRVALWANVTGVDVITVAPEFNPQDAQAFWLSTYARFSGVVGRNWTLMSSYGDRIANEKAYYADIKMMGNVWRVPAGDWVANDIEDPMNFRTWHTTTWDSLSGDASYFEKQATELLVD